MKLSIVIICWNDLKVIRDCLHSIYKGTHRTEFEVIVSDNGSTDGSIEFIRQKFPKVRVITNEANLGFARGNNVGIWLSRGEYVLILNPDTVVGDGALDRWVRVADRNPEAGGFGCRVLNPDGSYQQTAYPFPTFRGYWILAFCAKPLAYLSRAFISDSYPGWKGDTERPVDWQSGCCVMFRGELIKRLGGFDERFFYHYEEVDLCHRVWDAGYPILFIPEVTITHLGGQSVKRFPIKFELEKYRNRYRYFHKYYGRSGAQRCRRVSLASLCVRLIGYGAIGLVKPSEALKNRLQMYRAAFEWNKRLDPIRFVEYGEEPGLNLGLAPRAT